MNEQLISDALEAGFKVTRDLRSNEVSFTPIGETCGVELQRFKEIVEARAGFLGNNLCRDEQAKAWVIVFHKLIEGKPELLNEPNSGIEKALTAIDQLAAGPNIDEMVSRFLGWRLPVDFSPDGGVKVEFTNPHLSGTNLLNATQARAMIEFMLKGVQGG